MCMKSLLFCIMQELLGRPITLAFSERSADNETEEDASNEQAAES